MDAYNTFKNRADAGKQLALRLDAYRDTPNGIVLALPRGGVPVAHEVAQSLELPLDVITVRKLGTPGHEEMAMGAIAAGGSSVLNRDVINALDLPGSEVKRVAEEEQRELQRREALYREGRGRLDLREKTVILVDDGLATGATMRAAVQAVKQQQPSRVVIAVPVASWETCVDFRDEVDDVVCVYTPDPFLSVGMWYDVFGQTSDDEVRALLSRAQGRELTE